MRLLITFITLALVALPLAAVNQAPNIVVLYADDLGYGDIACYGGKAIPTPNLDRLAGTGLRFTDGHCTSSTCTPSRYALLTGEYPWRNPKAQILPGDAPAIIRPGKATLPSMLKEAGYATAVVGKWHLGIGDGNPNWNDRIQPGPNEIGFDESFIMAATGDRVPCVYLRNGRVVNGDPQDPIEVSYQKPFPGVALGTEQPEKLRQPADRQHSDTIINGISRIGHMRGGRRALWKDETMADLFVDEARRFIQNHRKQPFFLYFASQDPHVPRVPHPRFVGASGLGPRGDAIVQLDWCVGAIVDALAEAGLTERTLVVFSSDNGPVLNDGYEDQAVELNGKHTPAGPYRGGKYSLLEAGTRVPFILNWPGTIRPGVSEALVNQLDWFASFARLAGKPLKAGVAPDSRDTLDAFLGKSAKASDFFVHQPAGKGLSLREGDFQYIPAIKGAPINTTKNIETGRLMDPRPQLYNLREDPGARKDLSGEQPEKVRAMQELLDRITACESVRQSFPLNE